MKTSTLTPFSASHTGTIRPRANRVAHTVTEDFDIALLNNIARRMSAAVPLRDVLNEVVEVLTAVVTCDSCVVYVLEKDELVLRASKNPHPEIVDRLKMKLGQGITGWVAEHLEPVVVSQNACDDPRFKLFNELPEDRFESFLSVPIVCGARLVGVINVQNRAPHEHTRREIGLIAALGFLVGAEIERARLESENLHLAAQLETRKLVERAKGILQRESRQRRKTMKEVSEAIILTEDLMRKR